LTDYDVGVNSTGSAPVYTCLFWYDDMSFDDTVTVYPRYAEISGDDLQYPHTNDYWTLTCTYYGAPNDAPVNVTWSDDSGDLTNGSSSFSWDLDGTESVLMKMDSDRADNGNYTCTFSFDTASDFQPEDSWRSRSHC